MKKHMLMTIVVAALAQCWTAAAPAAPAAAPAFVPKRTLAAFSSEQELEGLFKGWAEAWRRRQEAERARRDAMGAVAKSEAQASNMAGAPMAAPAPAALASVAKSAANAADESITNVQHAGVDEGGIVKQHGDYLVVLRRGRLFTVAVGDRELRPVAYADAYGEGIDPRGAWYDEMLMWGDTIAVIGYSYARGGTEIGLFRIDAAGRLASKGTWHLRSNDYYSSRNYASRLIGSKLVFYTPLHLNPWQGLPADSLPAMRRWHAGAQPKDFKRIAPATRIYRAGEDLDPLRGVALHTVSVCDLAKPEFSCESTAVLGEPGRVFYVAPGAVYVWNVNAGIFRIPLEGGAPSMLRASGSPVDQFSFLEGADGMLNVLVRSQGRGEGMWAAEGGAGALALLRVPVASFSDGRDSAPAGAYRPLPAAGGYALQNRFVGDWLLYGSGAGWRRPANSADGRVHAVNVAKGGDAYAVPLVHGVDRIEALGRDAVVVGSDGRDLHFTSLRLARFPVATDRYTRPGASQGETRSHGFFYKPDSAYEGVVGLPIVGGGEAAGGHLRRGAASVLYLRNEGLSLRELGTLDAGAVTARDACRASCVDWYGNARPIFLRGRVFALLGYELVEGRMDAGGVRELRRASFAPDAIDRVAAGAPASIAN